MIDLFDSNSDYLSFERYQLELMLITSNASSLNYGAGISYHLDPELKSSNDLYDDVVFDNALGFVVEMDLKLGRDGYVGIKYTSIDYETDNPNVDTLVGDANFINKQTFEGNSIGIVIGLYF